MAVSGADFVVLDMEAAASGKRDVLECLLALNGSKCAGIVRVPWLKRHLIDHALDVASPGIIVPKIETSDEAAAAVPAAFSPPIGQRGLNPVRASAYFRNIGEYLKRANERTTLPVQIESQAVVERVDEIAAVPGLSGLFIGAGDLAASYGHPGDPVGADMDQARKAVLAARERHSLIPGIFAYSLELAVHYRAEGFKMIAVGNEAKLLREACEQALAGAEA